MTVRPAVVSFTSPVLVAEGAVGLPVSPALGASFRVSVGRASTAASGRLPPLATEPLVRAPPTGVPPTELPVEPPTVLPAAALPATETPPVLAPPLLPLTALLLLPPVFPPEFEL